MMSSSEYKVTIKSANQKVDDFVTTCRSNWSVHQLKQHISETHINKPSVQDQRLIYAGNIMKDSQNLKQIFFRDSLCTEFSNSNKDFTIHLVCGTPKPVVGTPASSSGQAASVSQATSPSVPINPSSTTAPTPANANSVQQTTNTTRPDQQSINSNVPLTSNTYIYRQTTPLTAAQQSEMVQNLMRSDQMRQQLAVFQQLACMVATQIANTVANNNYNPSRSNVLNEPANIISSFIPGSSEHSLNLHLTTSPFSRHLSASQMLLAGNRQQSQYVPTDAHNPTVHQNENHINENNANVGVGDPGGAQFGFGAQMQAAAPAPVVEQPAPRPDQEVHLQHDLIDWVYYSIRAAVFMAALYIHASMFRLLFIVSLLAIAYFFNRRSVRRAAPAAQVPQNELPVAAPQQGVQENPDQRRRNIDQARQPVVGDNNTNQNNNSNNNNDPGTGVGQQGDQVQEGAARGRLPFLKLCYLVVTDFLASLVPE